MLQKACLGQAGQNSELKWLADLCAASKCELAASTVTLTMAEPTQTLLK